ncbi:MAG: HAD family hydrolase [Silvanigrellaceae bacterium]
MGHHFETILCRAKCFLWDFDGCFADTERLHFFAYRTAFAQVGHNIAESDYYPSFTHLGDGTSREIFTHKLQIAEEEIARVKAQEYKRLIAQGPVSCFSETLPLVRLMHARGAKVAIASNSSEEEIQTVLSTAGFPVEELDLVVGKRDGLRKKPAPDIFLHALEKLSLRPEEAVVLEDSNRGLMAAAAAGCHAIWVRTRYNDGLQSNEPHLNSLSHGSLLELMKTLPPS